MKSRSNLERDTLHVGLIGVGRITQLVHLAGLQALPGARLVGAADPDARARDALRSRAPGLPCVDDPLRLFERDDLDAVVIATPPHTHADLAAEALRSGLHVYVEKPLSHDLESARALHDVWAGTGLVGAVGFNQRRSRLAAATKQKLAEGAIGRPIAYRAAFCAAPRRLSDWKAARGSGGGVLLDLAAHHVDLAGWLLDRPVESAACSLRSLRSEDDTASLTLRLAGEVEAQISCSLTGSEVDRFEIIGDDGILTADRYRGSLTVEPVTRRRSRGDRVVAAGRALAATPRQVLRTALPVEDDSHRRTLAGFVDAVAAGRSFRPDLSDGVENLEILDAAERSARGDGGFQMVERSNRDPDEARAPATAADALVDRDPEPRRAAVAVSGGAVPELSVVLVATEGFAGVARVVRHLREQTNADGIELLLVAENRAAVADVPAGAFDGLGSSRIVEAGPIDNVDRAAAYGIYAASAPIVAIVEDHAYPAPGWARAIVDAHRGPWAAVGSAMRNANPRTSLSWTNLLLAYGAWTEPIAAGETTQIARHNVSFKREALSTYGTELESRLGRDGDLFDDLRAGGARFFVADDAVVEHANPSRLRSTIRLRFEAGRLAAARRADSGAWSRLRRSIYTLASPIFPLLRSRFLVGKILSEPLRGTLVPRALPALALGLTLDAMGQALGFAVGPGRTAENLAAFEVDRLRHVTSHDRQLLST
ncbi:MAG: Gfo/Idh/MocA family oxidoreductase [Gemmatimonadetes bacterium]|nr:Gfo/Idh/MocA family oxidoreductase [Gemmatimonadota bacterium]